MLNIFTFLGVAVAVVLFSLLGGLLSWAISPDEDEDVCNFLIGMWFCAITLAIILAFIVIDKGLI